jgi:hypothetical protein
MAHTSANVSKWAWDAAKYRAAAQLADGRVPDREIAKQAGVNQRQIDRWKKQPSFAALVAAITDKAADAIRDEAVASKAGRLRILVDLHNKLLAVIEARAERHADERAWAAGESTGLIVTEETWGKVESRKAAVDTATLKELRSYQEQIVKELNDWDTSVSVKHSGRVDHVHRVTPHDNLTVDQLEALEAIALDAFAKEHAIS